MSYIFIYIQIICRVILKARSAEISTLHERRLTHIIIFYSKTNQKLIRSMKKISRLHWTQAKTERPEGRTSKEDPTKRRGSERALGKEALQVPTHFTPSVPKKEALARQVEKRKAGTFSTSTNK